MMWYGVQGKKPASHMPGGYDPKTADVLKTHAIPQRLNISPRDAVDCRAIFMFGDPVLSVISTRRSRWDKKHFANCGCFRLPSECDIYRQDVLHYGLMFNAWMKPQQFPLLALRFETAYRYVDLIRQFTGATAVALPAFRERNTKRDHVSASELDAINFTYQGLIERVREAPDIAVWSPPLQLAQ
jgi:hypothetical protein